MEYGRVHKLTQQFCADIAQAIRSEVAEQMKAMVEAMERGEAPQTALKKPAKKKAAPKDRPKQRRTFPEHCVHEGCANPHCGPKYRFLCRDHRDAEKVTKQD